MGYLEQVKDKDTRIPLINALRTVTAGKVHAAVNTKASRCSPALAN